MKLINFILSMLLLVAAGCKQEKDPLTFMNEDGYPAMHILPESIEKFNLQFENGSIEVQENFIVCDGSVISNPKGFHELLSPVSGKVIAIRATQNQYIDKHTDVATIEDADLLGLQQKYLDAKNQYEYFKEEYKRQGELTVENATSLKKMQIARRDFQSAELTYSSLEKQLKMLGIESDSLTIDNLNGAFPVKSPWAGTIRNLGIQRGVYIRKGDVIGNIEETNRKYLKITVPEKAFLKVATGDTMQSWPKYDSLATFKSIVSYKEDHLDALTHTGTIYALIPEHLKLITGLSVRTKVRDNEKINVVVNRSAIFKEHDKTYVFSKYQGSVVKFPVQSLQTAEEKIRLINFPIKYADSIIISGTHLLNRRFTKP